MRTAARMPPFGPIAALALVAGAGAALLLPRGLPLWLGVTLCVPGLIAWAKRQAWGPALAGFGYAAAHVAFALSLRLPATMERGDFALEGTVQELPVHEVRRTSFLFEIDRQDPRAALRGRLVRLSWFDDAGGARLALMPGERWRFVARLRAPRGLRNPGAPDSEKFALARRLTATGYLRNPQMARRLAPARGLDAWRARMSERIAGASPGPSTRFVRALALGDVRGLDDADWQVLRTDGLTHLIAISGFHVGLVAGLFALLARALWWWIPVLGRRFPAPMAAAVAAAAGGALYAAVAGGAVPTVRTALAIALVALARTTRRRLDAADLLALCAVALVAFDPLAMLGAGFWLSFAGVGWLVWCLPAASAPGVTGQVRGFLSAQGVATLGLLPLSAVLFGQASTAGPLANLVAVPWWSLVVVPLSLLGLAAESLHVGWGQLPWQLATAAFDLTWPAFRALADGPLALLWLPEPRWYALPLAMLGTFWMLLPRGARGKWVAALLWLPLLWPDRGLPARGEADILLVDVGQGLSVLVRTRHHALVYDMGPAVRDGFDAGERAVVPAMRAWGVHRVDRAFASHGDNDHVGGLPAVRAAFALPRLSAPADSPVRGAQPCERGQSWTWDGVRFRVLHPTPYFPYLGNESSCVLRIETAHGAVLLPGDVDALIERELVRRDAPRLRAEVVVVAHHGSGGSSDPAFIAATGARYALVSSGYGNRFRHPRPEVVERWQRAGAAVWDTQDSGAVEVRMRAEGVELRSQRASHPRAWDAARDTPATPPRRLSYRPD